MTEQTVAISDDPRKTFMRKCAESLVWIFLSVSRSPDAIGRLDSDHLMFAHSELLKMTTRYASAS